MKKATIKRVSTRVASAIADSEKSRLGIRSVSEISRPRSWALYGRSGSGKTTLAATFPTPILLLDVRDQGTDSVLDHSTLDVKDVDTLDDLEDVYYYLKEKPRTYKTVVIDTVTQLQQVFTEEVVGGKRKRKDDKQLGDWGSMTRREFGDVAALMKEWVLNFRNLTSQGIEIVFLAQERVSINEDDNPDNMITPEVGPHVMPSVAIHLNANVSIIGNTFIRIKRTKIVKGGKKTEKEQPQYCVRIGPNPIYTTKIRKPKHIEAPPWVENPTYADILEIIKGE